MVVHMVVLNLPLSWWTYKHVVVLTTYSQVVLSEIVSLNIKVKLKAMHSWLFWKLVDYKTKHYSISFRMASFDLFQIKLEINMDHRKEMHGTIKL